MSFIVIGIMLVAIATAFVVVPLWRRGTRRASEDPIKTHLLAHEKQLKRLQRDLRRERIQVADYAEARRELESALQENLDAVAEAGENAPAESRNKGGRGAALIMAVVIPASAAGLYLWLGNWQVGVEGVAQASEPSVERMVAGLAHRLATTDSDDLKGWVMLGRSYVVMGDYKRALNAFSHARQLAGDSNANVLASYAEALALTHPAELSGRAGRLFEKALRESPNNPKALWYAGLAAYQQNHNAVAITRWRRLLAQNPPARFRRMIKNRIHAAGGVAASQPQRSATHSQDAVGVHISVAAKVRDRIAAGDALYVFLRRPNGSGPPLAVRRVSVKHFPVTITLSEQNAMLQGTRLSAHNHLEAVARVSKSGKPLKHSGDIMGESRFAWGQDAPKVNVTLNRIVR